MCSRVLLFDTEPARRILQGVPEGVEDNGSLTRVAAFPIGIDPERFAVALEDDGVRDSIAQLLDKYAGRKVGHPQPQDNIHPQRPTLTLTLTLTLTWQVMLGVDRLDMIKGIPQKLLAFEKFLEENPEWRDMVLLVQIAVPSRTDVPEYQVRAHCMRLTGLLFCVVLMPELLPTPVGVALWSVYCCYVAAHGGYDNAQCD